MKKQVIFAGCLLVAGMMLMSFTNTLTMSEDWEVPAKYEKMTNPMADDADSGNMGKMLYAKHCKSCHGSKGAGDGTKAESLDTEIRDFAGDDFKNQSDGAIYYKTVIGRDEMPSFEKKLASEEDRWLLVNYIKKF